MEIESEFLYMVKYYLERAKEEEEGERE